MINSDGKKNHFAYTNDYLRRHGAKNGSTIFIAYNGYMVL